jgi:hypothetical protein
MTESIIECHPTFLSFLLTCPTAMPFKSVLPVENMADVETDKAVDHPSGYCDWKFRRVGIYPRQTEPQRCEASAFYGLKWSFTIVL